MHVVAIPGQESLFGEDLAAETVKSLFEISAEHA
jgi:hypothetical protein